MAEALRSTNSSFLGICYGALDLLNGRNVLLPLLLYTFIFINENITNMHMCPEHSR